MDWKRILEESMSEIESGFAADSLKDDLKIDNELLNDCNTLYFSVNISFYSNKFNIYISNTNII